MKVKEFVDAYNLVNEEDREEFIRRHINNIYVPYEEKMGLCDFVIKTSTTADGEYEKNSPVQYVFFVMSVIDKYTNLDGIVDDVFASFNTLDEYGLVDVLIRAIDEQEINKFQVILNMMNEDLHINKYSMVAYLNDIFDKGKKVIEEIDFQPVLDAINDLSNNEKTQS